MGGLYPNSGSATHTMAIGDSGHIDTCEHTQKEIISNENRMTQLRTFARGGGKDIRACVQVPSSLGGVARGQPRQAPGLLD